VITNINLPPSASSGISNDLIRLTSATVEPSTTSKGIEINISKQAYEEQALEQSEEPVDAERSSSIDEIIKDIKEQLNELSGQLAGASGSSDAANQEREAIQDKVMLASNQLMTLMAQKAIEQLALLS